MAWKRAAAGEDWGDYVQNSNYPVPSVVGGAMQAGGKLRQGRDKFNKLGEGKGYVVAQHIEDPPQDPLAYRPGSIAAA